MRRAAVAVSFVVLSGCSGAGSQSALDPAAAQARVIADLFRDFTVLLGIIFLIVVGIACASILRRRRGIEQEPLEGTHVPSPQTERVLWGAVGGASILTTVILLGLIVISVSAGKAISDQAMPSNALTVEVSASQWWWNIRYINDDPSLIFTTANEIHIPVGRAVRIRGSSLDVIHSFWVPGLSGKRDLIPSRVTTEWFKADKVGRFRGQCAEFCGLQHAHMALWVVAEDEGQFNQWLARQRANASDPSTPSQQRGQQVFLQTACALCHTIRGTTAAGRNAPDLTHLASRMTIAAGTLPNNRGNLAGWISDPQTVKPGNHMATVPVQADELQALLDYLGSLQ